jgi:hypothetical protein
MVPNFGRPADSVRPKKLYVAGFLVFIADSALCGFAPYIGALIAARAVCTENLNPNVLTMKSAQYGARIYDAGSLNLARDRRIFVQRPMRSHAVVTVRIVFQTPTDVSRPGQ